MLNIDSTGYVALFYGKTDTWSRVQKLQAIPEAEPKETDPACGNIDRKCGKQYT